MLQERPNAKIKVFVLWSPVLRSDNKFTAQEATTYLSGSRVKHYWDLWSFGINWYTQQLSYPAGKLAWDIFLLYRPGQEWTENLPEPHKWMQNHNLDFGTKYTKEAMAAELDRLLQ